MTGTDVALIITAGSGFVTALGGLFVSIRNARKIEEVHKATNSMKDELVALTRKDGIAEGIAQEKAREVK